MQNFSSDVSYERERGERGEREREREREGEREREREGEREEREKEREMRRERGTQKFARLCVCVYLFPEGGKERNGGMEKIPLKKFSSAPFAMSEREKMKGVQNPFTVQFLYTHEDEADTIWSLRMTPVGQEEATSKCPTGSEAAIDSRKRDVEKHDESVVSALV